MTLYVYIYSQLFEKVYRVVCYERIARFLFDDDDDPGLLY